MNRLLPVLALVGCARPTVDWCEAPVAYDYAPDPASSFTTFPDDHWTEPDPSSVTGLRVAMRVDETPVFDDFPDNYVGIFDDLSTLDGFGLASGVVLRFDGAVAFSEADVVLAALEPDGPRPVAVDVSTTDEEETLLLHPRVPLPEATEVVAAVFNPPDAAQCVSPSPHLRQLLAPEAERVDPPPLSDRFRAALDALGRDAADVAAMTLFTTQSVTPTALAVTEDIASRDYDLVAEGCTEEGDLLRCAATVEVRDYRGPDLVVPDASGTPWSAYDLPVSVWLPRDAPRPTPVLLCGHGLAGDREQCGAFADEVASYGAAVLAVDAVEHGEHPARTEPDLSLIEPLMIFAIHVFPKPGIDGLVLRDNFRQSAWDKLQVVAALESGADLDGDGVVDLDPDRLAYVGVSLGAIMGPEPLALSDRFHGAALAVGGGRLTSIIQDSETFSPLVDLMKPQDADEGLVDRFFPMLQTLVDPGDPMVWAPHVTGDRLREDGWETQVLVLLAKDDAIVPNSSNDLFARGFGIPVVGEPVWAITDVSSVEAPLEGNLPGGGTGGILLFDEVQETDGGAWEPVDHSTLHASVQGRAALEAFLTPVVEGDAGRVIDPYAE